MMVHNWSDERHHTTENTTGDSIPGECAGGVDAVAVCHVVTGVYKDRRVPASKGHAGEDWPDPVCCLGDARPREPELADRLKNSADDDDGYHSFRWNFARFWVFGVAIDDFADDWFERDC